SLERESHEEHSESDAKRKLPPMVQSWWVHEFRHSRMTRRFAASVLSALRDTRHSFHFVHFTGCSVANLKSSSYINNCRSRICSWVSLGYGFVLVPMGHSKTNATEPHA